MENFFAQWETIMVNTETLGDIAVFVAVVDRGSFTRAADALGLSNSQVSKCVNRLERVLEARLLHRTTRSLKVTEAGAALHEKSSGALGAIEEAQLAVSSLQAVPRGTLKVSASIAFGSTQLPRIVRELTTRYPDLYVELLLEDRHVDLVREGVDVAVRITAEVPDSGLVYRRLGPNRQVVCASPAYVERRGLPRTLEDLANHDCIAHLQRATPRAWHFRAPDGKQVSAKINGRLAINSALGVRQAALEGAGVIELNSYLVGEDIQAGRLVRLLPQYRPQELAFYAVYPARRYLAPKVRVLVDGLLQHMAPEPAWDGFLKLAEGTARTRASPAKASGPRQNLRGKG